MQRVFQNLMETVVKTIYRSLRLLFVLAMTMALYSFVGTLFFGNIRSGEALDYSLVNFNGIFVSIHLVIRIMTGEDWYQIFWDTMVCYWGLCPRGCVLCIYRICVRIWGLLYKYYALEINHFHP